MSRDKEDRFEKTGTSPLWAVGIFESIYFVTAMDRSPQYG